MNKMINRGVYPTMITPYTADNKIDYHAVEQILAWYDERGVDGVFAICQSSEIFFLSFEERLELLRFVCAHKPANMSLVASGHTADDLQQQIEEAKRFVDCGIDAYVFIANRFAKATDPDDVLLENMFRACDALPGVEFGVYECPYPYKRVLTPYTMREMAKTGRFRFLKDTCCDLTQIKEKLDAVAGSDLMIFNANAATLLESMRMGCAGYSGVMANFHPELYSELIRCYESDPQRAEEIQNFVGFASVCELQCYPVNAKYYMHLDGLDINIDSRSRSKDDFRRNRELEIEQLHGLTDSFKKHINI